MTEGKVEKASVISVLQSARLISVMLVCVDILQYEDSLSTQWVHLKKIDKVEGRS